MIIPQKLVHGTKLSISAQSQYVCPANTKAVITNMTLYNDSSGAVTATVHIVGTGISESAGTVVIGARTLAGKETYTCPEAVGKVLLATGTIRAISGATDTISIMVDGYEVT